MYVSMKKYIFFLFMLCLPAAAGRAQSYTDYIDSSFVHIEKGDLAAAEQALLKALRAEPANPENVMLLSNLGTIQRRMGKMQEALKSYNLALMMVPQSVTLLGNRAALWAEMDSMQRAREDYSAILLINEREENALYRRGLISLETGDTTGARIDFERLLAVNPKSSNARIGMAALMKYRGFYANAIDLYTQVLRVNPQLASLYFDRAEAYFYNNQYNRADADVAQAILLAPDDPLPYVLRGRLKLARYAADDARKDFDKAVELGFSAAIVDEIIRTGK